MPPLLKSKMFVVIFTFYTLQFMRHPVAIDKKMIKKIGPQTRYRIKWAIHEKEQHFTTHFCQIVKFLNALMHNVVKITTVCIWHGTEPHPRAEVNFAFQANVLVYCNKAAIRLYWSCTGECTEEYIKPPKAPRPLLYITYSLWKTLQLKSLKILYIFFIYENTVLYYIQVFEA